MRSFSRGWVRVDGTISFGRIGPAFHCVFHFYPQPERERETCSGLLWITSTHPQPSTPSHALPLLLQLLLLGLLLRKIQTNNDILQIIPHRTLLDTLTLKWRRRRSNSRSRNILWPWQRCGLVWNLFAASSLVRPRHVGNAIATYVLHKILQSAENENIYHATFLISC